jgi:hypothetical protein
MTKWFGEPWPSAELRAPVCEDEADRVPPPPPGEECVLCGRGFKPDAQGVAFPHFPGVGDWQVRYSHIDCLIGNVTGEGSFALG